MNVIEGEELRPLVMSSGTMLEGETSEQQHDSMLGMLRKGGQRLQRWSDVINEMYPGYNHDVPKPDEIDIIKLHDGVVSTTDTFNSARKTCRLLMKTTQDEADELD